jgi:predicted Rossmann fold flavoprotein
MLDVAIIGGGAAGYYAAIQTAMLNPSLRIALFEKGALGLEKVKISGGGRCNVTHDAMEPDYLVTHYPRGEKALLGPFHHYGPKEVIAFFESQGVPLKIESDGRMFPVANTSQAILDCFTSLREKLGITLYSKTAVKSIEPLNASGWNIITATETYCAKKVLMATGSSPKMIRMLQELGHGVEATVPSLFTFNIKDPRIEGLAGLSTPAVVHLKLPGIKQKKALHAKGPLLITHWGLSGPAILKLSAWGARLLYGLDYNFTISVNFLPEYKHAQEVLEALHTLKKKDSKKTLMKWVPFGLPKRLWQSLLMHIEIPSDIIWANMTKSQLQSLAEILSASDFEVKGKSTFKEEFVTAGGIKLKEVSFTDVQSKKFPGLYFAGELLNIDAITGGFNFQNAWTTAYLAAKGMVQSLKKSN